MLSLMKSFRNNSVPQNPWGGQMHFFFSPFRKITARINLHLTKTEGIRRIACLFGGGKNHLVAFE